MDSGRAHSTLRQQLGVHLRWGVCGGLNRWIRCWILPVCLHAGNHLNMSVKCCRICLKSLVQLLAPPNKSEMAFLIEGWMWSYRCRYWTSGLLTFPPWQSVKRGRCDYSTRASNPALSPPVNIPHIEILSTQSFVSSISILLWCASWMPWYASRTAQSGRPLKEAMRPILMRRLSYWNCTGTFATLAFQFAFHNKWVSVGEKKNK